MNYDSFYMIKRAPKDLNGLCPTFYMHDTLKSAELEAERLAKKFPGDTFYILQTVKSVRRVDVEWKDCSPSDSPDF